MHEQGIVAVYFCTACMESVSQVFFSFYCLVFPGTWRVVQACGLNGHPVHVVPQPSVE